ncbi:MAG: hypothetical protein WCF96_00135 [Eubacteriales bacterium]
MKYGVKFCGGCNPRFERTEALGVIKNCLKDKVEFENVNEEDTYDGLLVIGGCTNICPKYKHYKVRRKPLFLHDKNQIDIIIEKINKEVEGI